MAAQNLLKVTYFFGDGRYGWSETYYRAPGTPTISGGGGGGTATPTKLTQAAIYSAMPYVLALAKNRVNMLAAAPSQCTSTAGQGTANMPNLEYIRISQVGYPRNTAFYDPQTATIVSLSGSGLPQGNTVLRTTTLLNDSAPDNPYSCVEMELSLANGLVTRRALSGVPRDVICDQGMSQKAFGILWSNFASNLIFDSWGVASNSIMANGLTPPGMQAIQTVSQNDVMGRPTITVAAPLAFGTTTTGCPDYRVQVFCYRSEPGRWPNLNGVYRVVLPPQTSAAPGTAMLLARSFKMLSPLNNGFVAPYLGPQFTLITGAQLSRVIMKKRGRPFGQSPGRAAVIR